MDSLSGLSFSVFPYSTIQAIRSVASHFDTGHAQFSIAWLHPPSNHFGRTVQFTVGGFAGSPPD